MKYYVLYNPLADNSKGEENAQKLKDVLKDQELVYQDVTQIKDMIGFLKGINKEDKVVLCGGDGTLNHLVNDVYGYDVQNEIYLYPTGTGNDFVKDLGKENEPGIIKINDYIKYCPKVTVNGITKRFINAVGYGIDGYCCEVGDELRKIPGAKIDYAGIAIKGVLGKFKPANGKITVDGKTNEYKKVWIAPTMNGRFYGGGMMAAPKQDRLNKDHKVTLMIWSGSGRIPTLMAFPSIFKGEHVKHDKMIKMLEGKDITVEFDKPTALQIDGETITNVTKYHVEA